MDFEKQSKLNKFLAYLAEPFLPELSIEAYASTRKQGCSKSIIKELREDLTILDCRLKLDS